MRYNPEDCKAIIQFADGSRVSLEENERGEYAISFSVEIDNPNEAAEFSARITGHDKATEYDKAILDRMKDLLNAARLAEVSLE